MIQIPRTVVINLDKSVDRMERFAANVARIRWPDCLARPERFVAVDGDNLPEPPPPSWRENGQWWGCALSHKYILQQAIRDQIEAVCIFEDDAVLHDDCASIVEEFFAAVPERWDMLYLGGKHLNPSHQLPRVVNDRCLQITGGVGGTYGYIVHARYMQSAIHWIADEFPKCKTQQIDQRLAIAQRTAAVFQPWNWAVGHAAGKSTINGHETPELWWPWDKKARTRLQRELAAKGGAAC